MRIVRKPKEVTASPFEHDGGGDRAEATPRKGQGDPASHGSGSGDIAPRRAAIGLKVIRSTSNSCEYLSRMQLMRAQIGPPPPAVARLALLVERVASSSTTSSSTTSAQRREGKVAMLAGSPVPLLRAPYACLIGSRGSASRNSGKMGPMDPGRKSLRPASENLRAFLKFAIFGPRALALVLKLISIRSVDAPDPLGARARRQTPNQRQLLGRAECRATGQSPVCSTKRRTRSPFDRLLGASWRATVTGVAGARLRPSPLRARKRRTRSRASRIAKAAHDLRVTPAPG